MNQNTGIPATNRLTRPTPQEQLIEEASESLANQMLSNYPIDVVPQIIAKAVEVIAPEMQNRLRELESQIKELQSFRDHLQDSLRLIYEYPK